jgi:hypothetical protein
MSKQRKWIGGKYERCNRRKMSRTEEQANTMNEKRSSEDTL